MQNYTVSRGGDGWVEGRQGGVFRGHQNSPRPAHETLWMSDTEITVVGYPSFVRNQIQKGRPPSLAYLEGGRIGSHPIVLPLLAKAFKHHQHRQSRNLREGVEVELWMVLL